MANREALRELQARLASRLKAARSEGVSAAWLAVNTGGENYLLPLVQSGEIFPLAHIQVVPYCQPWFIGVTNLRGGLFGVVDLAGFLKGSAGRLRAKESVAESSVVTFNATLDINCALLVDGLSGLRKADSFTSAHAPMEGSPTCFGSRFTDLNGVHWQEINLRALAQTPEFLSISA
jgi:twitching motility protein PilI